MSTVAHSAESSSMESPARPARIGSARDSELCATVDIPVIRPNQIDDLNNIALGRGTYGSVEKTKYRKSLDEDYMYAAIKYANSQHHRENLIREAKILTQFRTHPNVISIYGIYDSPKYGPSVVMEYMDCKSLAALVYESKIEYTIDHVASWMYQLVSAVDYFHSNNQVHRDLKLQNMLLSNRYTVMKICDFGTFRTIESSMTDNRGTPLTMAPEVFQGTHYTTKSDMFSVGIIMWQLLSREKPYPDYTVISLLWNVASGKTRPPELDCHYLLSGFYKRCWHQQPEIRPTSKEALEYFQLLKNEYPNGTRPLIDGTTNQPARTPQPPSNYRQRFEKSNYLSAARSHRRTGSDQTAGIRATCPKIEENAESGGAAAIRNGRSKSIAAGLAEIGLRVSAEAKRSTKKAPEYLELFAPAQPDVRDPESMRIFNEHTKLYENLVQIAHVKREVMAKKHLMQKSLAAYERKKQLHDRIKQLRSLIAAVDN
ncbi:unnamed protein product [Caenorhabditis bovis]|uniref:Protein kinase domain-containing protein n=1 Tax=Caenorhabditis bovis TaxID=2654633 RepID=A0A8S1F7F0_9PELO|nr:unnamed protein product [Caenorhabditis bovis]